MKILVIGTEEQRLELIETFPDELDFDESHTLERISIAPYDYIFDLDIDNNPELIYDYSEIEDKTLIFSAVKVSLAEFELIGMLNPSLKLVGINAFPGFINRPVKELSFASEVSKNSFEELNKKLKWECQEVKDRVGMVTPRVIFMIINEACYTLQEGTSNIPSIDQAMKLGTNYPKGPFEWADEVGIEHVYETLIAIFKDTGDPRYKVCPLLKQKYLQDKSFYE